MVFSQTLHFRLYRGHGGVVLPGRERLKDTQAVEPEDR